MTRSTEQLHDVAFDQVRAGFEHRHLPRSGNSAQTCPLNRENVVDLTTPWRLWDYVRTPPGPLNWDYVAGRCEPGPNSGCSGSGAKSACEVMGLSSNPCRNVTGLEPFRRQPEAERLAETAGSRQDLRV